ncbi:MAG: hypothetical protein R3248_05180 [Candidatus Promineifilaceae bacterium]|nr:hypothetical protein [Candidatus Promineifilaceae bacterium]
MDGGRPSLNGEAPPEPNTEELTALAPEYGLEMLPPEEADGGG